MEIKELYEKIREQLFRVESARSKGMMVNAEIDREKNILYNNAEAIRDALAFAVDAEKKIRVLETEIDDADRELKEKDNEIKRLLKAPKKKAAPAKDVEQG